MLTTGSTYTYARPYSHKRNIAGKTSYGIGIFGVETHTPDMPATGTATYYGESVGFYSTAQSGTIGSTGQSEIKADFKKGTVSVESTFTRWQNASGSSTQGAPFDTVKHTDMKITGSTFQGGTHTVLDGSKIVTPTGNNTTGKAQGNFFGARIITKNGISEKKPEEVSVIEGDSGKIVNIFIAD